MLIMKDICLQNINAASKGDVILYYLHQEFAFLNLQFSELANGKIFYQKHTHVAIHQEFQNEVNSFALPRYCPKNARSNDKNYLSKYIT